MCWSVGQTVFLGLENLLENTSKLKLISATSDGASSNRNFFRMCAKLDGANKWVIGYRTINIYAPERYIYFFSEVHAVTLSFATSASKILMSLGWQFLQLQRRKKDICMSRLVSETLIKLLMHPLSQLL